MERLGRVEWPVEHPVVWADEARARHRARTEARVPAPDAVVHEGAPILVPPAAPLLGPWVSLAVLMHLEGPNDLRRRVWARAYRRRLWRVGAPLEEHDDPPYPGDGLTSDG